MKALLPVALAVSIPLLTSCSTAASSGYGARGSGFIGSAYGFTDKKISDDSWMVEYKGQSATLARKGAAKRANEICVENGFMGVNFSAKMDVSSDGHPVAVGLAKCTKETQTTGTSGTKALMNRVKDIDVEIAAIERESRNAANSSSPLTGTLGILGGLTDQFADVAGRREIKRLKAERAGIIATLKDMTSSN